MILPGSDVQILQMCSQGVRPLRVSGGGPLPAPVEGGYIQARIVSRGLTALSGQGCEETALFSAGTNVSKFVPWLNQVIGADP